MIRLKGHEDAVLRIAYFPDSARLATASCDGTIRIWDVQAQQQLLVLNAHAGECSAVAVSPDGGIVASGHDDGSVRLWNAYTGEFLRLVARHRQHVSRVAFSPSPQTPVLASSAGQTPGESPNYGELFLTDWQSGISHELVGHEARVTGLAFTAQGTQLASASFDRTVRIWDVGERREKVRLVGHKYTLYAVAFSPDDRLIVTGGMDDCARVWSVSNGLCIATHVLDAGTISCASFIVDGTGMILGTTNYLLLFPDPLINECEVLAKTDKTAVFSVSTSPDSKYVAWNDDHEVCVWSLQDCRRSARAPDLWTQIGKLSDERMMD